MKSPHPVDMASVRRLLIIKLSALGDVIHALPVSAALGEAYPHLEISWAVEEAFAPLVIGNPYLKEVLTVPKLRNFRINRAYVRQVRQIRARKFDLTLDLQGLTKSAVVAVVSGAKTRLGYHWLRETAPLVETPVPRAAQSVHVVDQYLDVARFLGASPAAIRFPFHIPEEDDARVTAMLCAGGLDGHRPYIAVNPASALAIKQWDAASYARLMDTLEDRLGMPSVLVTADTRVAAAVRQSARRPFVDLSGRTNLKQLAAVLRRCAVHVCGDTGSGHLAAALERPVVALIGPTDPKRACPFGQERNAISRQEVCGAGCNWHRCQFAKPRCMAAIEVDEVVERIETLAA